MDEDEVNALLGLFAAKITDRYDVLESSPQQGVIVVRQGGTVHRLHFDREAVAQALDADESAFWGPGVDRVESAARFMTVHLVVQKDAPVAGCTTWRSGGGRRGPTQVSACPGRRSGGSATNAR